MFQIAIYYLLPEMLIKVIDTIYRKIVKLHILNRKTAITILESLLMKNQPSETSIKNK